MSKIRVELVRGDCIAHGCRANELDERAQKTKANSDRYLWLRDKCNEADIRAGLGWLGQNGGIDAAIDKKIAEALEKNERK